MQADDPSPIKRPASYLLVPSPIVLSEGHSQPSLSRWVGGSGLAKKCLPLIRGWFPWQPIDCPSCRLKENELSPKLGCLGGHHSSGTYASPTGSPQLSSRAISDTWYMQM